MGLNEAVGEAVRQMRVHKRLSQEALAELAGLHRNFVGMLERAETSASVHSLEAIARALHCRASDIVLAAETLCQNRGKGDSKT